MLHTSGSWYLNAEPALTMMGTCPAILETLPATWPSIFHLTVTDSLAL